MRSGIVKREMTAGVPNVAIEDHRVLLTI